MTDIHWDRQTLLNMADRLRTLADDVEDVEAVLSDLTAARHGLGDQSAIQRLQNIDSVCQSLRDLAKLSAALTLTGTQRQHAIDTLRMSATRSLMQDIPQSVPVSAGDVDLF